MTWPDSPTHVQIQTTTGCGAACSICPHPVESPGWSNGLMTDAVFEHVLQELADRPIEYLCPYLMADPMSDRKIFDRMNRLRALLPTTHFELSTTGLYLVPKVAERLLEAPLDELRLSSHGLTAEEWATTMPGIKHDRGWPNLLRFIEHWKECRPYPLRIVTLVGLWSESRDREIAAFWADQGVEIVTWRVISRAEQVDLTVFGQTAAPPLKTPPYRCQSNRESKWLHILSDGRLSLCCMDYKHEAIVGNMMESSLDAIWHGERFDTIRRQVRGEIETDENFLCHRCEWHESCVDADEREVAQAYTAGRSDS